MDRSSKISIVKEWSSVNGLVVGLSQNANPVQAKGKGL